MSLKPKFVYLTDDTQGLENHECGYRAHMGGKLQARKETDSYSHEFLHFA